MAILVSVRGDRRKYVLDLDDLGPSEVSSRCRSALGLVAADIDSAETDLPWHHVQDWPDDVRAAAERLRDRFVEVVARNSEYMQTGVRTVTDAATRRHFVAVAPYAYDATFWHVDGRPLAELADEGQACVLTLTDEQRTSAALQLGEERVISLADWRRAHPSLMRRLLDRVTAALRPG
ncbi:hypothetical protein [Thalassiella azotivora]